MSKTVHIVRRGDTVYSIARKYGVSDKVLMSYNKIKDERALREGQRIVIPVIIPAPQKEVSAGLDSVHFSGKSSASKTVQPPVQKKTKVVKTPVASKNPAAGNPFSAKISVAAKKPVETAAEASASPDTRNPKYTIKKGDNFEKIEKAYWLKPGQLKKANPNVSSKSLKIGQEISIPEKEFYYKPYDKNDKNFDSLINKVLKSEGGILEEKNKDGTKKYTYKGIQQSTYDAYLRRKAYDNKTEYKSKDVRNITDEEIKELYYNDYYLKSGANTVKDKKMAYWTLDTAVQCGVSEAQRLSKICKTNTDWYNERLKIYNSYVSNDSSKKKYLNGWKNRIDKIKNVTIS